MRVNQQIQKLQKVEQALDDLKEQIEDDEEIKRGKYIFYISRCPKTEREAMMLEAKQMDSVIVEDS